jgi:hypothetical protein
VERFTISREQGGDVGGKSHYARFLEVHNSILAQVIRDQQGQPYDIEPVLWTTRALVRPLVVDRSECGEADPGITQATFQKYARRAANSVIFKVSYDIAWQLSYDDLMRAQDQALNAMKGDSRPFREKMVDACNWVLAEKAGVREPINAIYSEKPPAPRGRFTLPDPADRGGGSDVLLRDGGRVILAWLEAEEIQPHLGRNTRTASTLRRVRGELAGIDGEPMCG